MLMLQITLILKINQHQNSPFKVSTFTLAAIVTLYITLIFNYMKHSSFGKYALDSTCIERDSTVGEILDFTKNLHMTLLHNVWNYSLSLILKYICLVQNFKLKFSLQAFREFLVSIIAVEKRRSNWKIYCTEVTISGCWISFYQQESGEAEISNILNPFTTGNYQGLWTA